MRPRMSNKPAVSALIQTEEPFNSPLRPRRAARGFTSAAPKRGCSRSPGVRRTAAPIRGRPSAPGQPAPPARRSNESAPPQIADSTDASSRFGLRRRFGSRDTDGRGRREAVMRLVRPRAGSSPRRRRGGGRPRGSPSCATRKGAPDLSHEDGPGRRWPGAGVWHHSGERPPLPFRT